MIKKYKFLIIFFGILVLLGSLVVWATVSPIVDDYYFLYNRDTESDLAVAFAVALRSNHPAAYNMIDVDLTSRLDEWMNTHQSVKCVKRLDDVLVFGSGEGLVIYYVCQTEEDRIYDFSIDEVMIKDMKVVDWGEIREVFN